MGRDLNGVDCFGLVKLILTTERGANLPDFIDVGYSCDWYRRNEDHIVESMQKYIGVLWAITDDPPAVFDALLFYNRVDIVNHIGLYIGDRKFIHIMEDSQSRVDKLSGIWKNRLYKVVRWLG